MSKQLSLKQQAFVAAFIGPARGNATESARLAGYKGSERTLISIGSENLTKPDIQSAIEAYRSKVESNGIAHLQTRVDGYDKRRTELLTIVAERSLSTDYTKIPGGRTGWLVRTVKQIGGGENAERVEEYAFDAGLHRELRELEKQAAQDLGQWSEKREITNPDGQPIQIVAMRIVHPE